VKHAAHLRLSGDREQLAGELLVFFGRRDGKGLSGSALERIGDGCDSEGFRGEPNLAELFGDR
jgi:hypothetical protein